MSDPTTYADLLDAAVEKRMTRRSVLKRAMALGLTAPAIAALLSACGSDDDDEPATATSAPAGETPADTEADEDDDDDAPAAATATTETEEEEEPPEEEATAEATPEPDTGSETGARGRGQGDTLQLLIWQAPTMLNTHFAQGDKDVIAARVVLEPLMNVDSNGELQPVLVEEVPSLENGDLAEDGLSVTYRLKQGVVWSDGEPFTAEDVHFTWEMATNQEVSATTYAVYALAENMEIIDDYTIRATFAEPNPAWITLFSGTFSGAVLPKHILGEYEPSELREAPFNLHPIGTGPYVVREFRPGDVVLFDINENYREPDKPFFSAVEMKGGGDALSAARAVVQLGEGDYAWNLQIEKDVFEQLMSQGTEGYIAAPPGNSVEQVFLNSADPNTEVDGARSEPSTQHPFFSDPRVREALKLATDREVIATELYGEAGVASANVLVSPAAFESPNTVVEYDPERAIALLEEAGWELDGDVRRKDGQELSVVFTSTINTLRQRTQEVLKQSWTDIGFRVEIRAIDASVYFSSDTGNPDTVAKFYADLTMFTNGPGSPYPIEYMSGFISIDPDGDISQQSNGWSGNNYMRWVNEEFNELWAEARTELDPARQAELFIQMNDIAVNEVARIGLVHRGSLSGFSNRIKGHEHSRWDTAMHDLANWYAEE